MSEIPLVPEPTHNRKLEVIERNDALGGRRRLGVCRPHRILYLVPRKQKLPNGLPMPPKRHNVNSTGCGTEGLLSVPYGGGKHHADVCVVDDAVDRWPRFRGQSTTSGPMSPEPVTFQG